MGFGVPCPMGVGQRRQRFVPRFRMKGLTRFPREEVGHKLGGHGITTKVFQRSAGQSEGSFEKIGADQCLIGSKAVEDDGGSTGSDSGRVKFPNTGLSPSGKRTDGGRPMNLFGAVAGLKRSQPPGLARRRAGLIAVPMPRILKLTTGKKLPGHEGPGKDQHVVFDRDDLLKAKEPERKSRRDFAGMT